MYFISAAEMRYINYRLSLWFLLLAAISFVGNIAMGVGFGVSGCRLTRRLRVLVFGKFMRYPMGAFMVIVCSWCVLPISYMLNGSLRRLV